MLSLGAIASKVFGSLNDRKLKKYGPVVAQINALEPEVAGLTDDELRGRTAAFRARVEAGAELDDLIPEAFVTVREAAKRTLGQRHFDVQLIGGMVLHEGRIAEMKTGEGKTLVATMPVYLNALAGRGVHVVTVNDYLAKRDAAWMGVIYKFLGLSVGCIVHELNDDQRREQYACDVTYGTNNEFGFDYLRDNMKYAASEMVQRGHYYAIVDEVDSILIDEARTPLIISGPLDDRSELYNTIDKFIPELVAGDFELDEKTRVVTLTEAGNEHVEQMLTEAELLKGDSLYDIDNVSVVHHVQQALRAHTLFQRDRDYIVKNDEVIIIDEFTGRMMQGRRYSEGLHQALEAKEHVTIQPENQTLAGMTGTAVTEADEFLETYGLDVVEVPTNMDMIRADEDDEVYRTAQEKYRAIINLIKDARKRGQPMLVGTVSIEKSEILSGLLKKEKVPHQVLNARYHEQEAHIIAQAGVPGAITIATNMAGRGTDIQLGGNPDMLVEDWLTAEKEKGKEPAPEEIAAKRKDIMAEVAERKKTALEAGGLYVVGTERHESRRIDNQLRGRSGRQGDPGETRFYLSLEDELMRLFKSDWVDWVLQALKMPDDVPIENKRVTASIASAQGQVEAQNFEIRKNLLKYDDVMNRQRHAVYSDRRKVLEGADVEPRLRATVDTVIEQYVIGATEGFAEDWDLEQLWSNMNTLYPVSLVREDYEERDDLDRQLLIDDFKADAQAAYDRREESLGEEVMRELERRVLLTVLDRKWREHLYEMDYLREGIGLRAMAQRDPLVEYQREGGDMFNLMMEAFMEEVVGFVFHLEVEVQEAPMVGVVTDSDGQAIQIGSDRTETPSRNGHDRSHLVESGPDPDGPGV